MNDANNTTTNNLERVLALNDAELEQIFSQLSLLEIENLLDKLNEVEKDD